MSEIVFQVEVAPEGGFTARALGHSIFTEADTREALVDMVREAVVCHFEVIDRVSVVRLKYLEVPPRQKIFEVIVE